MQPYLLAEIQTEMQRVNRLVGEYFAAIPVDVFFAVQPGVWSPGENLAHLCKTVRPVTLVLRAPRRLPTLIWGGADSSRRFAELVADYKAALAAGGESPAQFVNELEAPENPAAAREEWLGRWSGEAAKLEAALAGWKDEDLDKANVPHPLLGKLTLRELLLFTLYHNLHHVNDVRALLGQPALEV
ncbi:MAG: DinB family protein [Anaerolineales bacterium]|nr:DinB family protein [Anaerolineales bacterium]